MKIGILTRDCAGVNAAIRSIVRTAVKYNIEIIGVKRGYSGLIDADFVKLDHRSVSGIINKGGTILKTSRCKRFYTKEGQEKAIKNIHEHAIDGLIVIGGNGSLTAAKILADNNIKVIGIPATIDNDVNKVELTLGADTAVNVALDALDKIRDTATSLERIFIVEVMGRQCGYIALQVALAGGCEEALIPERDVDIDSMCNEIIKGNEMGKKSWIVIVAEGKAKAHDIAEVITKNTNLETRVAVLGHIQRGGRPTAIDRLMAARLGNCALEMIKDGFSSKCVFIKNDIIESIDLSEAIQKKTIEVEKKYSLIKVLT